MFLWLVYTLHSWCLSEKEEKLTVQTKHTEVSNTYKITSSESLMLIRCEEISNLARHKEEYNTAPKIDQSQ